MPSTLQVFIPVLKKKKIRDERLNKVFDKKISKFWFEYSSN